MAFPKLSLAATFLAASASFAAANTKEVKEPAIIAGYESKSQIKGSKIDLDQAEMENHLEKGDFRSATLVFRQGGHDSPYAKIALEAPLREDIPSDTTIVAMNNNGEPVDGMLMATSKKGSRFLYVTYSDGDNACHIQGSHTDDPKTTGCFQATGGMVVKDYGAVNYHYNILHDNQYWSTLYGFSEHEGEKMFHCRSKCPYPEYEKFYKYYGRMDYGNLWVTHALEGTDTQHGAPFINGNQDFSLISKEGRAKFITTATVAMNTFTQINRIMTEWSIEVCDNECREGLSRETPIPCPKAANNWDLAVSYFVGSLDANGPSGSGRLLYSLANAHCQDFGTCDKENIAKANRDIMNHFSSGRGLLETGVCLDAAAIKFKIDAMLTIPMIQGLLKSAYNLKDSLADDEERGRGAAYVAALMPQLAACSHHDAIMVEALFNFHSKAPINFQVVRDAFERNYQCLQVTCQDIGGLVDDKTGDYIPGLEPCDQRRMSRSYSSTNSPFQHNSRSKRYLGKVFLLCCVALVGAMLVINRDSWLPAVSGNADMLLSSLGRRIGIQPAHRQQVSDLRMYEMSEADYRPIAAGDETLL